jgi:probable phosphoglycerate mutase
MPPPSASRDLIFVRHGATAPNLAGIRCGGDLDVPLVEAGRRQAAAAGERIRALGIPVGVIVTSDLRRTRETAEIICRLLNGVELVVEPAFAERRLGAWNMRSVADTETAVAAGVTPPGGESADEFFDRIAGAVETLLPRLDRCPLLVGSKGVARVLRELLGLPDRHALANGDAVRFDLSMLAERQACRT